MKNTLLLAAVAVICMFSACTDETKVSHMEYMDQLKDTIFKKYNTVSQVTVEVMDDRLDVKLWDTRLFNAPQSKKEEVAQWLGLVSGHIFQEEAKLDKGVLNITTDNDSGIISTDIHIAVVPKK